MRSFDLTPLFRNSVGYDRMARMIDNMASEAQISYPPYNIEKLSDDDYVISMAVAGFGDDDLDITVTENLLTIAGQIHYHDGDDDLEERIFLHRGIAERAFERRFTLADHIKVEGANLANGLLHVALKRQVPESAKPQKISIASDQPKTLDDISTKPKKKDSLIQAKDKKAA